MNTSDVVGLLGLIVAINALVTAIFLWAIEKERRQTKRNVDLLTQHIKFTNSFIDSLVEFTINQEILTKIERGRINESIKLTKGDKYLKQHLLNTKRVRRDISRCRQELMLHTKSINAKESAYKQLANACGNITSYEIISNLHAINKKDMRKYSHFKRALKERLKDIDPEIKNPAHVKIVVDVPSE